MGSPLKGTGAMGAPVIVVSPRQDVEAVTEVVRCVAGHLIEGDYCTCALSSTVVSSARC
ncbi:hypothetical protein [Streptomyces sp. NBC_00280]|uniref:hypothetical protein n=1 Tax=Streptomyces sp. NBC_00280 TaxID=2975699 RepID=UPI00352C8CFE